MIALICMLGAVAAQHDDSLVAMARLHGGNTYRVDVHINAPVRPLPELAQQSDLILHGTLVTERGRLSADERAVYTEYEIRPFRVLKGQRVASRAGATIGGRVRAVLPGGTAHHDGFAIQMDVDIVPHAERFRWGAEVVVFLTAHEAEAGVYRIPPDGAFRVLDGQAVAMTRQAAKARGDKPEPLASFLDRVQRLVTSAVRRQIVVELHSQCGCS